MGFIIKHDSAICTPENSYSNMRVLFIGILFDEMLTFHQKVHVF